MQKIIALVIAGVALGSAPALPAFAAETANQTVCGPDAPEAYKRPGGYCEQVGDNKSAASGEDEDYYHIVVSVK